MGPSDIAERVVSVEPEVRQARLESNKGEQLTSQFQGIWNKYVELYSEVFEVSNDSGFVEVALDTYNADSRLGQGVVVARLERSTTDHVARDLDHPFRDLDHPFIEVAVVFKAHGNIDRTFPLHTERIIDVDTGKEGEELLAYPEDLLEEYDNNWQTAEDNDLPTAENFAISTSESFSWLPEDIEKATARINRIEGTLEETFHYLLDRACEPDLNPELYEKARRFRDAFSSE